MNPGEESGEGWTLRHWILGLLLALAAQFGCLFWFSNYRFPIQKRATRPTQVRFTRENPAGQTAFSQPDRNDPTLFALVTPEGFSGSAWLTVPRFRYEATNQPEPLHWLTLPTEELGDDFAEFVQTNSIVEEVIPDQMLPMLAHPNVPMPLIVASTVIHLQGDLAASQILSSKTLPQMPEPILSNTVVRVMVDSAGWERSASVVSTSGVALADQEAFDFVKTARFRQPRGGGTNRTASKAILVGNVVFQWAAVQWSAPGGLPAKGSTTAP